MQTTKFRLFASAAIALGSATLFSPIAMAQTTAAASASSDIGVGEVVVTARKTAERIQDVPLSITAFNNAALAERGQGGLMDVAMLTPGLTFQEFASTFDSSPTIRGLTESDVTSSISNVSTVLNGVYIPRNYSIDLGIVDIGQTEVIKGPQSALYGGNAFAGVISYTTNPTSAAPHADVSLTGGNAGRFDAKLDASGSVLDGKLQVRGFAAMSDYSGTWKNNYPSGASTQALGGHDNYDYGFSAKYTPIAKIEADVTYFHLHRHEDIKPGYNFANGNCGVDDELFCGKLSTTPPASSSSRTGLNVPFQPGFTSSTDFLDAKIKAQITPTFNVTYLFGHVRSYATEITSQDPDPIAGQNLSYDALFNAGKIVFGPYTTDQKEGGASLMNSHELRFDYSLGHFNVLFGLYYASYSDTYKFALGEVDDGQAVNGDAEHPLDFDGTPFVLSGHATTTDTTAEFGSLGYSFMDNRAHVAVEVRHSSDAVNNEDLINIVNQKATFDTTTPRFTADFKVTPNSLLYASAAEGVKNGGFNGIGSSQFTYLASQQVYQPETNWTYEFGTKNSFFNGRVVLNADIFYVKWTDMQIEEEPSNTPESLRASTSVITTNLGNATSYGLEASGLFKPMQHLDLTSALSIIDPTFDKGTVAQGYLNYCDGIACATNDSIAGKMLSRTSKVQLTSGATWSDTFMAAYRWNVHGEFTYQSKQYADDENLVEVSSRVLFNASATIRGGGPANTDWDLTLWGRNIFDRKYVADAYVITPNIVPSLGERATFGATLNLHY